jgi:hypothetical protein
MKNELFVENKNSICLAQPPRQLSPFLQLAQAWSRRRAMRLALPLPRRESCVTRRAMLAASREAELTAWMATGGDFLARTHSPNS